MTVHFEYHAPGSWDEAVALMGEYGSDARPLAGGTDLMIQLERRQIAPPPGSGKKPTLSPVNTKLYSTLPGKLAAYRYVMSPPSPGTFATHPRQRTPFCPCWLWTLY
jgi:hypothetical protein